MTEPATTDSPPPGYLRTADILGALSLGADLAVGLTEEHGIRACYMGLHIAQELELLPETRTDLYYAELLIDAGCTAWTSPMANRLKGDEIDARKELYLNVVPADSRDKMGSLLWLMKYMAPGAPFHVRATNFMDFMLHGGEYLNEALYNTSQVALRMANRLGMSQDVQDSMEQMFERWDGKGPNGFAGIDIPLVARILYMTGFLESYHRRDGREAAIQLAKERRGKAFDPSAVDAFLAVSKNEQFWKGLEQDNVWDTLMESEPDSPYRYLRLDQLPDVALSFADFVDIKSRYTRGQSRRVAETAVGMAQRMGLSGEDVTTVRIASLMHDIGLVSISSFILEKHPDKITPAEWEQLRLHPYTGQRILSKVPALDKVASVVGAHHERMDGSGYHRGLSGSQIPVESRIIAVADRFDELTHDGPEQTANDPASAFELMALDVGPGLCPDSFQALVEGLDGLTRAQRQRVNRRQWPAGLTDREVEVLRLVAKGLTRRQMAEQLVVSESTARTHLEHIYEKAGVSSRAGATLFAMEQDLL